MLQLLCINLGKLDQATNQPLYLSFLELGHMYDGKLVESNDIHGNPDKAYKVNGIDYDVRRFLPIEKIPVDARELMCADADYVTTSLECSLS
ncbi:MAG: hypothetical protein WCF67_06470 [Chitinophagaceae bacterium]